jgi:hypothetical protein
MVAGSGLRQAPSASANSPSLCAIQFAFAGWGAARTSLPRVSFEPEEPVLAVDVDGVISLFGFDGPLDEVPGSFQLIDGIAHCIADGVGPRLARLAEHFDMIWATGWEERANDHLPQMLGLAGDLHALTFGGRARFGTAHWKLEALDEYAQGRPLAWIDDSLDESCRSWADAREAPTLLVETRSEVGLTDAHVDILLEWARALEEGGA